MHCAVCLLSNHISLKKNQLFMSSKTKSSTSKSIDHLLTITIYNNNQQLYIQQFVVRRNVRGKPKHVILKNCGKNSRSSHSFSVFLRRTPLLSLLLAIFLSKTKSNAAHEVVHSSLREGQGKRELISQCVGIMFIQRRKHTSIHTNQHNRK